MNIDEAIKVAEAADPHQWPWDAYYNARFNPETVLALLRFVQAYDECTDALPVGFYGPDEAWREWGKLKDARAAVDEALK